MTPTSDEHTPKLTRRAVLATSGAAALAGCSNLLSTPDSPDIDCTPGSTAWPAYGYGPGRTSSLSERTLPGADAGASRLSQTGTREGGGGSVEATPVVADGVAYTAGDVRVEARDVESGDRLWETDPGDGVVSSPVLACGTVYVSTLNETLALARDDGSLRWRADVGIASSPAASPVAVDDTLYLAGSDVVALDAETGEQRWTGETGHSAQGIAVGDRGRVYASVASNDSGAVVAFTGSGDEWWQSTDPGEVYAGPAVADGTVYAASKTGTLTALDADDGSTEWQSTVEEGVYNPPAVADGRVFVEAGNGTQTMAFDAETGDRLWEFETGVTMAQPTVVGDRVLATGANTGLHLLDAETGERERRWPVEHVGSQPVVVDGRVLYRAWNVSDVFLLG